MRNTLFISKKIHVGFQNRGDTFTNKLAYIIYEDEKGKLRKEVSWNQWRDKNIPVEIYDNVPLEGYIVHKSINTYAHWVSKRSAVRIYDPRGFEFEINLDNLVSLISHANIEKGEIKVSCILAQIGAELVLIPTNSELYQEAISYTARQDEKVSAKNLVPGYTYLKKKGEDERYIYVGYYDMYSWIKDKEYDKEQNRLYNPYYYRGGSRRSKYDHKYKKKRHVFIREGTKPKKEYVFSNPFGCPAVSTFARCVSDTVVDNFDEIKEAFLKSDQHQKIIGAIAEETAYKKGGPYSYNSRDYHEPTEEENVFLSGTTAYNAPNEVRFLSKKTYTFGESSASVIHEGRDHHYGYKITNGTKNKVYELLYILEDGTKVKAYY